MTGSSYAEKLTAIFGGIRSLPHIARHFRVAECAPTVVLPHETLTAGQEKETAPGGGRFSLFAVVLLPAALVEMVFAVARAPFGTYVVFSTPLS